MTKELRKKLCLYGILLGLLALGVFTLLFPGEDFSMQERRYLAHAPENYSLTQWTLKDDLESFLSDRLPLRNAFVGVSSVYDLALLRRTQQDVWAVKGMLVERPIEADTGALQRSLDRMATLAEENGLSAQMILVPSAGAVLSKAMPSHLARLYRPEVQAHEAAAANPLVIPMQGLLSSNAKDTYFKTDHHWSLSGAYMAYEAYCAANSLAALPLDQFRLVEYPGFLGSTYSRSGLFRWESDTLRSAEPESGITFTIPGEAEARASLMFPNSFQSWDPYTVFMNGNPGFSTIENINAPEGHLLVLKDSFANTLLPLLSAHYSRITVVDLRYYAGNFQAALAQAGTPEKVLFCYSLDSVLNDTSVQRKLR